MNGIVFFKTKMLDKLKEFYLNEIGCELWLDQGDCLIFKHGNLLLGFCDREEVDRGGIITFFTKAKHGSIRCMRNSRQLPNPRQQ